jgi:lysozyme
MGVLAAAEAMAAERVKAAEGWRPKMYLDPIGKWTIGWGFCLDAGMDLELGQIVLDHLMRRGVVELAKSFEWEEIRQMGASRAAVCLEMIYNLGGRGFRGFKRMIAAAKRQDWPAAADEIMDSGAARMLPKRYERLARAMRTGVA